MAENPLLPNARLRNLSLTMKRAAVRAAGPRLEAVLAATLLHVEEGDFALPLLDSACIPVMQSLGMDTATPQPARDLLLIGTGAALALKEADGERFALLYLRSGKASLREPGWADTLRYASAARLPVIVVCVATEEASREPARASGAKTITWTTMQAVAKPLLLPVIAIDGEDAVAVYRAMQESVHRARLGGGPAVLWCVFPKSNRTASPAARLREYLAFRGLGRLAR